MMTPRFSSMYVADMALNERYRNSKKGISDCDTCMCEAAGIEDDGVDAFFSRGLDAIDDASLVVCLEGEDLEAQLRTTLLDG